MARALQMTEEPIQFVPNSRYTVDGVQSILQGNRCKETCRHKDLWQQIYKTRHRLKGIKWIKAHNTEEDAKTRGCTKEEWQGNKRADELATVGTNSHQEEDVRSQIQFGEKMELILATQR